MNKIILFLLVSLLVGCTSPDDIAQIEFEGMKPVYVTEEENRVAITEARSFERLGKIVYAAPYLLINERFKGIHVVDNSDPSNPMKLNFIQIPGNTDFTVRQGYIYANHGSDFKVFQLAFGLETSLADELSIQETYVIEQFFTSGQNNTIQGLVPPNYSGFFECVDPDKGIVVNWEETILIDPECQI